jgi:methylated-DNA-protein-cysteine methyltransferase-like protein
LEGATADTVDGSQHMTSHSLRQRVAECKCSDYHKAMSSPLYAAIYEAVARIPDGRVMSYGGVARSVGRPRGAQMIGWALAALPATTTIPWWRVVNREGVLTIANRYFSATEQAERLAREGVRVIERVGQQQVEEPAPWWEPS